MKVLRIVLAILLITVNCYGTVELDSDGDGAVDVDKGGTGVQSLTALPVGDTAFTDLTAGSSYSNFGDSADDTLDELFEAIDDNFGSGELDGLSDVTGTGNQGYLLQDDNDGTYSFTGSLDVDIVLSDGTPTTDGLLTKTTNDQLALGVGGTSTNYFSPTKDVAAGLGDSDLHTISEALANDTFEPLDATIAKTGANETVSGDWTFTGAVVMDTTQAKKISTQLKNANESLDSNDMGTSIRDNDDAANNTYTLPSVGATDDGMRITLTKLGSNNPSFAASDSDTIGDSSSTNAELTTYGATLTIEYCDADTVWLVISAYGTINLS